MAYLKPLIQHNIRGLDVRRIAGTSKIFEYSTFWPYPVPLSSLLTISLSCANRSTRTLYAPLLLSCLRFHEAIDCLIFMICFPSLSFLSLFPSPNIIPGPKRLPPLAQVSNFADRSCIQGATDAALFLLEVWGKDLVAMINGSGAVICFCFEYGCGCCSYRHRCCRWRWRWRPNS